MLTSALPVREAVVFISAIIYWSGVTLNAYRVRKHIGRSPNLKPSNFKEWALWAGWLFIIIAWIVQPLIVESLGSSMLFSLSPFFLQTIWLAAGIFLVVSGYAGTLFCYRALGDSWRIGINEKETTALVDHGPYRLIRHPIYLFQIVMLIGAAALLPTLFSLLILCVHYACVLIKALDEEDYLLSRHDAEYAAYFARTGRFLPRLNLRTE